jgi:hypothetical protein
MLELLAYMRANGFKTFIVSGGGVEFMRVVRRDGLRHPARAGRRQLERDEVRAAPDGPRSSASRSRLHRRRARQAGRDQPNIGRRPVFAFGNSDGDQQMLEWTAAGRGSASAGSSTTPTPSASGRTTASKIGRLDKAWDEAVAKGWIVVDMKNDWNKVFPVREVSESRRWRS